VPVGALEAWWPAQDRGFGPRVAGAGDLGGHLISYGLVGSLSG